MKRDLYLSFVVFFQMIVVTLQLLLPLLGLASVELAATYRVLVTLLTYLPGILIVMRRNLSMLLAAFGIYFVVLLFSYELFPASHRFIESSATYSLTPIGILTALFIASIRDLEQFKKMMLYVSRASLVIALAYVVAYNISPLRNQDETYSMSFGYSMLLPAMFLFTQKNLRDKISSLVFLVLIFLGGSRGPVVVIVAFYAVHLFLFGSAKEWKKLVPYVVVVAVAMVVLLPKYVDFESSRAFQLLRGGEMISHDSGREEDVYAVIRPHIMERPVTGWGIGADRHFLDGSYSHNVFIEVFIHYGIFLGSLLFFAYFLWGLRLFRSRRVKMMDAGREFVVMMFLYGFVPLLVSGSYLIDFRVWVMIGYFIRVGRKQVYRMQLARN